MRFGHRLVPRQAGVGTSQTLTGRIKPAQEKAIFHCTQVNFVCRRQQLGLAFGPIEIGRRVSALFRWIETYEHENAFR